VTWLVVKASEVGTSHHATASPCQDSCAGDVEMLGGEPLLWVFVADGAGSAAKGGEGAEMAIGAAIAFVTEKLIKREFGLSDAFACDLVREVRRNLTSAAEREKRPVRDFACTFLGIVSTATGTIAFQVGDGGIVLDTGDGLHLAVVPMSGEYANQTHFVTDEDAIARMQTRPYPDRALKVAAFTDGIQRIALNMAANTPHEGFFAPFFAGMGRATLEQDEQLSEMLRQFLASDKVNARTDDDKTLALACWKGAWPVREEPPVDLSSQASTESGTPSERGATSISAE